MAQSSSSLPQLGQAHPAGMTVGLLPLQHLFQLTDDPLFQPGDVALADAKGIGGFLLGVLHACLLYTS